MKIINRCVIVAIIFILNSINTFAQSNADAIIRVFQNKDGAGKVEIYKESTLYFGKTAVTGEGIPAGTIILKNLKYSGGKWIGKVFAVKRNEEFDCVIKLDAAGDLHLDVKAGMLSRKQTWARIK